MPAVHPANQTVIIASAKVSLEVAITAAKIISESIIPNIILLEFVRKWVFSNSCLRSFLSAFIALLIAEWFVCF